jgi:CheY-specific phosphatase CheX
MEITHTTVEQATREVLETSALATVLEAHHTAEADRDFAELIATLSLMGTRGGTLVVYCRWQQALDLASSMLGGESEPDRETVHDAVGEMVNQIGGSIKRAIGANGSEIMLSPPVVVSGSPLRHCVRSSAQPLSVELVLSSGALWVCLWPS